MAMRSAAAPDGGCDCSWLWLSHAFVDSALPETLLLLLPTTALPSPTRHLHPISPEIPYSLHIFLFANIQHSHDDTILETCPKIYILILTDCQSVNSSAQGKGVIYLTRITKDPDERRKELVDIAEQLFLDKGYEETAVSDIVSKAHVAQGTFYYYFSSKGVMLDAIIDRLLEDVKVKVENVVTLEGMNAVEKMMMFFGVFRTIGKGREKLMDYLHEERNVLLHFKLEKKVYLMIIPPLVRIIRQGVEEGVFDTDYPREVAISILASSNALSEGKHDPTGTTEVNPRILTIIFDLFARLLGAKPGTFMECASRMMEE